MDIAIIEKLIFAFRGLYFFHYLGAPFVDIVLLSTHLLIMNQTLEEIGICFEIFR